MGCGLAVGVVTFALLAATGPGLAIVWDEGYTLGRLDRMRLWVRALRDPARFAATAQVPAIELINDGMKPPSVPGPGRPDQSSSTRR